MPRFALSNAYESPVDVNLSDEQRAEIFATERVDDAVRYAKKTAKAYAKTVLNSLEAKYGSTFEKSDMELVQVMAMYGVNKHLREYAAQVCRRLVNERLVR
jgi:hypothetical protein